MLLRGTGGRHLVPTRRIHLPVRAQQGTPAETCSAAVQQARAALRQFREAKSAGRVSKASPTHPVSARIQLPLPLRFKQDDRVQLLNERDWPGGVQQRFHALRPLVDNLLFGYDAQFVGMLESEADGIGVWQCNDIGMTVVCNVNSQSFAPFLRLCAGDFGAKPTQADHTLLAVNCSWGSGREVGQLWDRAIKQQAAEVIQRHWHDVYHLNPLRTSQGATGWLWHTWASPWMLYHSPDDEDAAELGDLIETFADAGTIDSPSTRPDAKDVIEIVNAYHKRHARNNPKKVKLW